MPCRSFDRGYHVAAPGQVVEAAGGSYGTQTVLYDASKEGAPANVIIRPAAGATVTLHDLEASAGRTVKGATHLTVTGMVLTGDIEVNGCGQPNDGQQCPANSGGNYLRFDAMDVRGPYGFFCGSCDHVTISNSRIGPLVYGQPCNGSAHPEVSTEYDSVLPGLRKDKRPNHLTIDHSIFENFSRCTSADHTECFQVEPVDYLTVTNSIFRRCDTITFHVQGDNGNSLSAEGQSESDHLYFENNFFDAALDNANPGNPCCFSLRVPNGSNVVIRNNSWLDQPLLSSDSQWFKSNYRVVGNVGPFDSNFCANSYTSYSHNVFSNTTCGDPSSKTVGNNFGFKDPTQGGSLDLHLLAGSPAIGAGDPQDFPAYDIDGQARPLGGAPDAGADEQ
jgi:hypothetical protein